MELAKKEYSIAEKFIKYLVLFLRILLFLSIFFLVMSCIFMLSGGFDNEVQYSIMWFSVMGSGLIYYFSIASIIGLSIFYKITKEKVWQKIKKELILLLISIFCFLVLGLINNYIL
jgi:hypothetical protein